MPVLSIILPTYNEVGNIAEQINVINRELEGEDFEILVVDDDSPDGTAEAVRRLSREIQNLRLIVRTDDKGLVQSIREGLASAEGDICLWMDADLSMPASSIKTMIAKIRAGADLVVGSRYVEGGGFKGADDRGHKTPLYYIWKNLQDTEDSFINSAVSKYGNAFAQKVLDNRYYDYTSGFYAVRKSMINEIGLDGNYLDYCIGLLYKASVHDYKIYEIPVLITTRTKGISKTSTNFMGIIPIAWDCLKTMIKLKLKYRKRR